jgi:hypothetical protein
MAQDYTVEGRRRRFVFPRQGDTVAALAERLFPGDEEAANRLLSWNLHLAARRFPIGGGGNLLATDIVYVEPPQP